MKKTSFLLVFCVATGTISAQKMKHESTEWYKPAVEKIQPANKPGEAPSDAVVLFDGKNLDMWTNKEDKEPTWTLEKGTMRPTKGSGPIYTRQYFGDCQLHIEFKSPKPKGGKGQGQGNSGVFLQSTYEVQVLDGDNNPTYVNGMVGSIYKQQAPLVNAYTKNGEWQVYDIIWKAPKFGTEGVLESPAVITVLLNGVVVQNNYTLKGDTPYIGFPKYTAHGRLPIMLQDHGEEVEFRNIWIRDL